MWKRRIASTPWLPLLIPLAFVGCTDSTAPDPVDQGPNLELFESTMTEFMAAHDIEAGALGVMKDGAVVFDESFGWQDSLATAPLPEDAMMRLASVSKPITAAAIRHLVADGLLQLDDHAFDLGQEGGGVLPLDPFPELGDPRLADITIEHLLQHRGGWDRSEAGDLTYREIEIAEAMGIESPPGRANTVRYILGQPLEFTPGGRYEYANIGYLVLGLVVEEVTGTDYMSFVRETVFEPLGVADGDVIRGRTFPEDRSSREPWYDSNSFGPNVFDPEGDVVRMPVGGWDHEARVAQGGLVASPRAILEFLEVYQVAGDDIGALRTGNESSGWRWNHTGSLWGTNALARQRGDGVNYVVLFNKRPSSGTSYAVLMRTRIDQLIDGGEIRWP